ncbi:hypothetical protein [Calidifontibacillus oryziterrae]|uniref:hypothetical protein n=1 Tax=Calidifontibacillus oryziterrae TaxID=1191699 RepID=UPI0002D28FF1|nr:hypothetical protein [Calidifontibacillus oryziterrae]
MRQRNNSKSYTINFHSGNQNIHDIIGDLARKVINKDVDDFNLNGNTRVKKISAYGRAV